MCGRGLQAAGNATNSESLPATVWHYEVLRHIEGLKKAISKLTRFCPNAASATSHEDLSGFYCRWWCMFAQQHCCATLNICTHLGAWYWQLKTEVLGEKSAPMPLGSPRTTHELAWNRNLDSAVRHRQLCAWVKARPLKVKIILSYTNIQSVPRSKNNRSRL